MMKCGMFMTILYDYKLLCFIVTVAHTCSALLIAIDSLNTVREIVVYNTNVYNINN